MDIKISISALMLILFGFSGPDVAIGQSYGDCKTPNNESGSCIPLNMCTPLYSLLESLVVSETDREYLRQSQCGNQDGILVCCAKRHLKTDSVTQEPRIGGTDIHPGNWLPEGDECPKEFTGRVIGGSETDLDEFPWMAMVEYTKPGNAKGHHCGGALINNYYVVTAAHCISKVTPGWRATAVRLGEWDTTSDPDCDKGVCAPKKIDIAVEVIVHPQYSSNARSQYHDIALLRLAQPVEFTRYMSPICLPSLSTLSTSAFTNYSMDTCGWGATENGTYSTRKLKAALSVADLNKCRSLYITQGFRLESSQMCAGGVKDIDSCSGDSGGPLIHRHITTSVSYYYLAGIVSFGPTICGTQGWPGVYTRVGPYVNWIKSTIKA